MISFFIANIIVMVIINQARVNSKTKVLFYLIINLLILIYISTSLIQFIELLIVLLSTLYLFANCYTIRYSSLRIKILNDLIKKKKITSEEELYINRIKIFKNKNKSFMNKHTFILFNSINEFFRKIFI